MSDGFIIDPRGGSPVLDQRDDGVREHGLLEPEDREVFGSGPTRGTVTAAVPIAGMQVPEPAPPPPDHPAWADALLVPPSSGGLLVARSMDDALRKAQ